MRYLLISLLFSTFLFSMSVQEKKQIFLDAVLPAIQKVHAKNVKQGKYVHPISITLAQAAIESGWGTSRFFKEANNIFGVWSYGNTTKRIAALQKRNGKTIWLRKYDSLEDSVADYYVNISKGNAYKKFRELNTKGSDIYELVKELKMYSEKREIYSKELSQIIKYNKFTQYDEK